MIKKYALFFTYIFAIQHVPCLGMLHLGYYPLFTPCSHSATNEYGRTFNTTTKTTQCLPIVTRPTNSFSNHFRVMIAKTKTKMLLDELKRIQSQRTFLRQAPSAPRKTPKNSSSTQSFKTKSNTQNTKRHRKWRRIASDTMPIETPTNQRPTLPPFRELLYNISQKQEPYIEPENRQQILQEHDNLIKRLNTTINSSHTSNSTIEYSSFEKDSLPTITNLSEYEPETTGHSCHPDDLMCLAEAADDLMSLAEAVNDQEKLPLLTNQRKSPCRKKNFQQKTQEALEGNRERWQKMQSNPERSCPTKNPVQQLAEPNYFPCPLCESLHFEDYEKLLDHARMHDKNFKCPKCLDVLANKYSLGNHILRKHSSFSFFECEEKECKRTFIVKDDYTRHEKEFHNNQKKG